MSADEHDTINAAARALAKPGASRGGGAHAERLMPEDRSSIARRVATARRGTTIAEATHIGQLRVGDRKVMCAVLEDGTRVVSQATLLTALGRSTRGKHVAGGALLFAKNLQRFISPELDDNLRSTIAYRLPTDGKAVGYRAVLLPDVCEVYLDAAKAGKLLWSQQPAARAAEFLHRGLARLGATALVDRATGYQEVRARHELQRALDGYVQAELRALGACLPG